MTRPVRILISAAAGLALVAAGTAVGAAIAGPVDGQGVIHGCYTNKAVNGSHVFVLQDASTNCPAGTTAISWNQQGPAGPAGPAGPQGPAGATGPQGQAGPAGAIGPAGPKGDTGATGPAGNTGPAGPTGAPGPPGSQGPAGANGNTVLNGTGPPGVLVGNDGDFYLDTAADVLYGPKAGGTWPVNGTSLAGSPGTGASVASLAAGDAHCANGGASITDGGGNTAYACNGAGAPSVHSGGGTAKAIGTLGCPDSRFVTVANPGSDTWYYFIRPSGCPSLAGIQVGGAGYVFDLYQDEPVGPALGNGLTETGVQAGTYFIDVYGGTSTTFTLTLTG